ncbi:unnamed protein product [Effrenium voratum]|uniref:Uncharacterized protein n=1 Tax=Effrenium voratum TaxID=2562239 RepID=A0AA36NHC4_9DINO|nr:unnamed protein product [Effrenium voratum]
MMSNEVWFVQAYDPNDGSCKSFATGWEDVAHTYGEHARFGRLDVTKPELKTLLPFKPVLLPVVFRYARGMSVEHFMFSDRMGRDEENSAGGGKALRSFMENNFPEVQNPPPRDRCGAAALVASRRAGCLDAMRTDADPDRRP